MVGLIVTSNVTQSESLIVAARCLRDAVKTLKFAAPVAYRLQSTRLCLVRAQDLPASLRKWPQSRIISRYESRSVWYGANRYPVGEIAAVRDWLGIQATIERPPDEHPKRPVMGFNHTRSEISGRRLWGLFAKRFGSAEKFFEEHLVVNYCPLAFVEATGRNRTPDKLPPGERAPLFGACDEHLREIVRILKPEWLIGIGDFAGKRARDIITDPPLRVGQILHPSPVCPASNNDWPGRPPSNCVISAFGNRLLADGVVE